MDNQEFEKLYYNTPSQHNDRACDALREYETKAQARDEFMYEQVIGPRGGLMNGRRKNTPSLPYVRMDEIARKYCVTEEEMKQHWRCIEKIKENGKDN